MVGRECDELGEGGCQVDGHQDHRVQACDPAAEACPVFATFCCPCLKADVVKLKFSYLDLVVSKGLALVENFNFTPWRC